MSSDHMRASTPSHPPTAAVAEALARIRSALAELSPVFLELEDESHRHEGHGGHRPGRLTHLRVRIVSEVFRGQNRIARHRLVNGLLAEEISLGLHALAIEAKAPGE
ncbi:BolA family transcriptional regulator [Ancylobacter sp. 6x-1]|uniref:BolA family transcriptional regulator n=1 Tax=Ancylobacter crimeensis TaxID=2579147 RepID=A0ABT0DEU0_9HYPH|nr:BolA family protein [Ancylobacter crimeensis]MCK0198473.1 BolA family transcriptional regulator [Ancylobacter crimeensis]